ncbi:MAG: tRNA (adenosine(37)-N6)-threonylcarbamoyltransferase complex transferase subunit TsaD [Bacteroidota bacterium]|nr:tRNA (adenosine(37)-N6)-threonylcarbamoyltransferase complex transferase subunit TsaD [Bacteroidota bacterium]
MKDTYILGIESSCDDTSAAVLLNNQMLSNVIANQAVHTEFGGVVPELASRAHQQNIIPVIASALKKAGIEKKDLSAVAFTRGPGLLGSLLVGTSFAKAFSMGLNIPIIEIDHMQGHILSHFIQNKDGNKVLPEFPFLCLTVSGGHTQIVIIRDYFDMEVIGQTIDDAAGEAFDKAAKIMSLPYPGGPFIDKYAKEGDPAAFAFPKPSIRDLDFSFSGLKTSFLYFLRDQLKEDPYFIDKHRSDLCASIQYTIISILMDKVSKAVKQTGINQVAVAGGVSANSGLRNAMLKMQETKGWKVFIPEFQFTTDNAAMIAIAGYYKFLRGEFTGQSAVPYSRGASKQKKNKAK